MINEKDIQKRWSNDPSKYHKEHEQFCERHENADAITADSSGNLVAAVYYFKPYQCYTEHLELLAKMKEAAEKQDNEKRDVRDVENQEAGDE